MPYLATERARRAARSAVEARRPFALVRPVGASQVIAQVCPRAAERGLRPGMSLGQAQALVPELLVGAYDAVHDAAVLRKIAQWAGRFSPAVEPLAPDTLLVDVTGCGLLFGGEEELARQALTGLARHGFRARAALADTIGAAWALAVVGTAPLLVVPPGHSSAYLAPLPPRALRLEPAACDRLEQLGIRTIGTLLMLPRASLPARFGPALVLRLQQALGEIYEGLTPFQDAEPPFVRRQFEAPLADRVTLLRVAGELLAALFARLRQRELALRRLDCVLYYERLLPRRIPLGLARATRAEAHVARLLHEKLERSDFLSAELAADGARVVSGVERIEPTPGVTGLMLIARETSRTRPDQIDLFEPADPTDNEALASLVDRLAGRLGSEAVLRPQLLDDHEPEMASRYVSVAAAGCDSQGPQAPHVRPAATPRPVRLLSRPIRIRVLALAPCGPPTWFHYGGRDHFIARADGPERIETAWWRGPDVRRDYFRVTTRDGGGYWIFYDAGRGHWCLHGVFA